VHLLTLKRMHLIVIFTAAARRDEPKRRTNGPLIGATTSRWQCFQHTFRLRPPSAVDMPSYFVVCCWCESAAYVAELALVHWSLVVVAAAAELRLLGLPIYSHRGIPFVLSQTR
jgi:hypothetical protein